MTPKKTCTKKQSAPTAKNNRRSAFSEALMQVAKNNLKEFESRSDEDFLLRAEMERKLNLL
jgi:hypothetical protein